MVKEVAVGDDELSPISCFSFIAFDDYFATFVGTWSLENRLGGTYQH